VATVDPAIQPADEHTGVFFGEEILWHVLFGPDIDARFGQSLGRPPERSA
jgi:hypothetical protein